MKSSITRFSCVLGSQATNSKIEICNSFHSPFASFFGPSFFNCVGSFNGVLTHQKNNEGAPRALVASVIRQSETERYGAEKCGVRQEYKQLDPLENWLYIQKELFSMNLISEKNCTFIRGKNFAHKLRRRNAIKVTVRFCDSIVKRQTTDLNSH